MEDIHIQLKSINATGRLLAILMLGSILVAFDIFFNTNTLAIGILLLTLIVIARGYVYLSLALLSKLSVSYRWEGDIEGNRIHVVYSVCNNHFLPLLLSEVSIEGYSKLKIVEGVDSAIVSIPSKSCIHLRVAFEARTGRHRIGPLMIVVRDPLGMFRSSEMALGGEFEVSIYPSQSMFEVRRIYSIARYFGATRTRTPGYGVEFYSVRDYREGDEFRKIVWRTIALHGVPSVKEFELESSMNVMFIIVSSRSMFRGPYRGSPYEHIARAIATVSRFLAFRGDYLSLIMIDSQNGIRSTPGFMRGYRTYRNIVNLISSVNYGSHTSEDIDVVGEFTKKIVPKLPRDRFLAFIFTGFDAPLKLISDLDKMLKLKNALVWLYVTYPKPIPSTDLTNTELELYRAGNKLFRERIGGFIDQARKAGIAAKFIDPLLISSEISKIIERYRY